MKNKVLFLLFLLVLSSINSFSQDLDHNDITDFHPFFQSNNEMVGKNVCFNMYPRDYGVFLYVKKGKKIVVCKNSYALKTKYKYHVNDIVEFDGKKFLQITDENTKEEYYLLRPTKFYYCQFTYDSDEFDRIKQYVKEHFVYRHLEWGEKSYNEQPYKFLPYVEVGISGVDIFKRKYSDEITVAFYYFTGSDSKERFIEYDKIGSSSYQFVNEAELQQKAEEYREKEILKLKTWSEAKEKYGNKIADAIIKGGFWTEERIKTLIDSIGKEEAEFVVSGEVHIGMTKDLCELSWGKPDKINKTTYSFGTKEQWVYRSKNAYLYFDDDILTAITENQF